MGTIRARATNESSPAWRNLAPNVLAYAQVNLTLEVLGRRDDGYHALRSIMLPIGIADEISIVPAARFAFTCEPATLEPDNLVVRALARVGLGAAILRAAMDGVFGAVGQRDWIADARALGSDIPFFLVDGGALVEGTGERVTPLGSLPPWHVVLVVPDVHVATPAAFARLAALRAETPPASRPRGESASLRALAAIGRGDYGAAIAAAVNDFEPSVRAVYPAVDAALAALRAANPAHAMLSGSGGACFALCPDAHAAGQVAARLRAPAGAFVAVVPFAPTVSWRAPTPA
jgi:4-diphosphocytidyl-2-C-methyl-D-erythritol kinase